MNTIPQIIDKMAAIFEAAPWLKDHDKNVHIPVIDPADPKKLKSLPAVTWEEFYMLYLAACALKAINDSVPELPRS